MNRPVRSSVVSYYFLVCGLGMILLGMILILFGAFLPGGDMSVGGILLIGPIPIVFGSGPLGQLLALLATALTITMLAFAFFWKRNRDTEQKHHPKPAADG